MVLVRILMPKSGFEDEVILRPKAGLRPTTTTVPVCLSDLGSGARPLKPSS
jgi:hypothetical protein